MVTVLELIEQNPEFFRTRPLISDKWGEVKVQASRHMRRLEKNDLFDIARPNESDQIKDYRDTVRRDITSEGTWSWINTVSRIFIEHGVSIEEASLSDLMKEWIESGPFMVSGQPVKMNDFLYELILPMMVEDPNGMWVCLPIVPGQPSINPVGEDSPLSGNDRIGVMNLLVPSEKITFLTNFVVAWVGGTWVTPKGKKNPYYFIVDRENYYRYIPTDSPTTVGPKNKKVYYELELWYPHQTGELMVSTLGGSLTQAGDIDFLHESTDEFHQPSVYYESFLRPFFELADEVTTSFSDNQGVRLQHNSPKVVMDQIPCSTVTPNCKNGWVINKEKGTREVCGVCGGGGLIRNPGPFEVLLRPDDPLGEKGSSRPTMEYVSPPVENLKQSYETPWDLMKKAKRSIGLDLLEDVGESGVAKARRLEALNDLLRKVSGKFFSLVTRHLQFVESLLVPNEEARSSPRIKIPTDLEYKSQGLLKEEAESALTSDRFQSQMDYYSKKYVNSPMIVKTHRLSLVWAPILLSPLEEMQVNLLYGLYDNTDLAKKERAFSIFKQMAEELGEEEFMIADDDTLFKIADEEIKQYVKNGSDLTERLKLAIAETGN